MKTNQIKKIVQNHNFIFLLLAFVAFLIFHFCYKYHFFIQEQNQIFIYSTQYFSEYFHQNACLSRFLGDFVTQFFYYLFVGPAVAAVLIFLITIEINRSFARTINNFIILLISISIEVLLIFTVFNNQFRIDSLISIYLGFLFYNIYSFLFKKEKFWMALISIVLLYYVGGFATIIFATVYTIKKLKQKSYIELTCVLTSVFVIPIFGQQIFQTTYFDNLFAPKFYAPSFPDTYNEFSYSVSTEYYFKHFNKVEQIVLQQDTMTAQSGIYYNMIQAQRGVLPDKIKNQAIPELGTLIHIDEHSPLEAINLMNDFYYLIGDMAMSERAAIQAQVFSPNNRNVKMIKRLCEINLVTGDTAVALKYVRILEKTLLYKNWAKKHHPYFLDKDIELEILEKRKFCNKRETIRINDNCRQILIELLESNPENIVALDYLLCTDLILGQISTFKADYYKFCTKNNLQRLNQIYIDALSK